MHIVRETYVGFVFYVLSGEVEFFFPLYFIKFGALVLTLKGLIFLVDLLGYDANVHAGSRKVRMEFQNDKIVFFFLFCSYWIRYERLC